MWLFKLDKEYGGDMDDILEMREVIVRTGNDRCTLVVDMTHQPPLCGSGG